MLSILAIEKCDVAGQIMLSDIGYKQWRMKIFPPEKTWTPTIPFRDKISGCPGSSRISSSQKRWVSKFSQVLKFLPRVLDQERMPENVGKCGHPLFLIRDKINGCPGSLSRISPRQ
jgi:hypothetical protein